MKLDIDWRGLLRAIAKAALPFIAGWLTGCSITGAGVGITLL